MRSPFARRLVLVVAVAAALPGSSAGQLSPPPREGCRNEARGLGTVRGRLLVPRPDQSFRVELFRQDQGCVFDLRPDSTGRFELTGAPIGPYTLSVVGSGAEPVIPIDFELTGDRPVTFDIPVWMHNRLFDCLLVPSCNRVLSQRLSGEATARDRGLRLVALRLALAMAIWIEPQQTDWVACLDVASGSPDVDMLREVYPAVAQQSDCEPRGASPARSEVELQGERYFHLPTDRPARRLRIGKVQLLDERSAQVTVDYFSHVNGGSGFQCVLDRFGDVWTPRTCVHVVEF